MKDTLDDERLAYIVFHRMCQEDPKTQIDEHIYQRMLHGMFSNDEKLKTHMVCIYKKFNVLDVDGRLNKKIIITKWEERVFGEQLEKLYNCLVDTSIQTETIWSWLKCQNKHGFSLFMGQN